jgi:hypothetical protein
MARVRVHVTEEKFLYIHNDLRNAAPYFKKRVDRRFLQKRMDGVFYEMLAALTLTAFAIEAMINFFGHKLISDWKERESLVKKMELVGQRIDVRVDWTVRPFSTIKELKGFRDTLAHGKPEESHFDGEIVASHDELYERGSLRTDWEKSVTEEFVVQAFGDMSELWEMLLSRSGLRYFDTITHGVGGEEFIEHVPE